MTDQQAQAAIAQAIHFLQTGQALKARDALLSLERRLPRNAQVHFLLGAAYQMAGDINAAIASYDKSISLNRTVAEPYFNRGILLHAQGRFEDAATSFSQAVRLGPPLPERFYNLGLSLYHARRYADAIVNFKKTIALKSDDLGAHVNCGNALYAQQKYRESLEYYDRALALKRDLPDIHFNRGNALRLLGRLQEAVDSFDAAIALHPNYAEAYSNRGTALHELHRFSQALDSHNTALRLRPDMAEAYVNLGGTYASLKKYNEALDYFAKGLQLKPDIPEARLSQGDAYHELGQYDLALQSYIKAIAINPDLRTGLGMLAHTRSFLCDWTDYDALVGRIKAGLARGIPVCTPFAALALDVGHDAQIHSASLALQAFNKNDAAAVRIQRSKRPKIRLGYYSADFYRHAAMTLMAELFEVHDRSMFELVAMSYGFPREDDVRARVKKAFDRFIDVKDMSDDDVVRLSRESEIDIAIDLTGHTAHARVGIFAGRAAPLQTQYLGFPGSMGSSVYDYIIGDRVVIPETEKHRYPEKVIFMPESFQVNDRTRLISASKDRAHHGLPAHSFVFASFNQSHKFNPNGFRSWMNILNKVEGSVLWLIATHPLQVENLRAFAAQCGVDPMRLIFGEKIGYEDHLARYRVADLVLDTLPFNGGATTSDALWAGAPVVTQAGESYAGRMAASLLSAVGLPDLIAKTTEEYERLAVELAHAPEKLSAMRRALDANRMTCPLFDSRRFTRHLEAAYQEIWRRHEAGLAPDHVYVQPIA